jgi:hypothetical protein
VFVDDAVLFVKPLVLDLHTVKGLLESFGDSSGLRINYNKMTTTMIRGSAQGRNLVRNILRCNIVPFPLRYLGMQLALRPLTKAEWQPFLDRIVEFVPAWQRGLIQKQGRLILVKSLISAKATHQCLVAEAPVWLLEEVAKWMRAFLWAGKNKVNGGQCGVAWDKVCKPLAFGGLGIKDMRLQGLALRTRWEWLRRMDSSRPWYGLPMLKDSEAEGVFRNLASIKLGSGASVLFWTDR